MSYTCQSETGKIRSLFIKRAGEAFVDEASIDAHWQALNFLGKPDLGRALVEYGEFEHLLTEAGASLEYFPRDS